MNAVILSQRTPEGRYDLVLNRPDKFNALSESLLANLKSELSKIAADPAARVVVISGAGKAFCAGHDLVEMQADRSLDAYRRLFAACTEVMEAIAALPIPVIARVHGVATAAGCQLVGACDLAVASENARFAVSGINVGLFCSTPAVALSRNVPTKRAFEMLVTGRFIDARTASDWGLVNTVTAPEVLDAAVDDLANTIIAKSPGAIRRGKALFQTQRERPRAEAYALACEVMAQNMMDENTDEGITAFLEKRSPVWR
ncbi:enoyl-CoA hydratase [Novosphingobium taihuense]|uniref:Enoyl-CoA hydratase domain-containing protein 3, mitochondrial n=1 Tax=Novosphingobium taihuense TaxID=260085 RepID=A0A7W7AEJ4_9SPHN|nr:enoyl-CoA hydratase [Novosphingobium taihuense]MBB4615533.1 enoyl-CoA hydratase/carnithine racemase [Novosphingobium taihuense]TWH82825.1 Enoyl-CoA hydratase [Novosphingobium taihuense]